MGREGAVKAEAISGGALKEGAVVGAGEGWGGGGDSGFDSGSDSGEGGGGGGGSAGRGHQEWPQPAQRNWRPRSFDSGTS